MVSEATQQTFFRLFLGREPWMPLDVLLPDPLPDKDAPSMLKRAKEEVWQVRDAVADHQRRNLVKIRRQYTTPGEQIRVNDIVLYLDKRPHPGIPQRLAPQWTGPQ